jgi:hypothetical protein
MTSLEEPARRVPVLGEYDVLVLGGGPAGIAAAVAAARLGARTLLAERYGFLGGMGTVGGVTNFAGLYGRVKGEMTQLVRGVADDLLERIDALGGLNEPQDGMQGRIRVRSYDVSAYKCAADELLLSAGAKLLFHAWAVAVVRSEHRLDAVIVETKSGRRAIRADAFVDCTGDADIAHFSGLPYEVGDGRGGGLYPSTMFRVGYVDPQKALAAVGEFKAINELMARAAGRYKFPREGAILRPQKNAQEWRANVTQVTAPSGAPVDATDALELSEGEIEGRRQVVEYFRFLRNEVPGFERAQITEIAPQLGIRESRRLKGVYALSGDDIRSSARFPDSIGINAWPMELHVQGRIEWRFPDDPDRAFNELPWRMLLAPGLDNLLVAGRCASMTHEGQSAARASGACFAMGQAAGTAAALSVQDFHAMDGRLLGEKLRASGAITSV